MITAPSPADGFCADGYEPVARTFAAHLASREELGASLTVYHRGQRVVHLWGGLASTERRAPFDAHTRVVVFSVTKGLASMALALLADRGAIDYDAPVATYWPGFGRAGKERITVAQLLGHRAGLPVLDTPLTLEECLDPEARPRLVDAMERQRPLWEPGTDQGYHAITFGMYARELFERVAAEPMGAFLSRELFEPLGADVSLGTQASDDHRVAVLHPPSAGVRLSGMTRALVRRAIGKEEPLTEWRIARDLIAPDSLPRRAFVNPKATDGIAAYDRPRVWRAPLAWASATGTSDGVARAYLPFSLGGSFAGRRYVGERTLSALYARQGWSPRDRVLKKPIGWSHGFVKDEPHIFSPTRESFGHPGIGGALGWCDPVHQLSIGYVMNKLDWHVRSPRAIALCRAVYASAPVRER